ncbi:MAG: cell division protein FtsK [Rhodobacterales bacterium]|nr:MAG: cell division protein FtsK [Rhodobacterales bacterium]
MAYSTRDPLFDSNMQAAIEKRGKELAGLTMVALGAILALALWSYAPSDPSWASASDAPIRNWLGNPGALVAAPLMMIAGMGAWGVSFVLMAWGLRLAFHYGDDRMFGRVIFAPIAIAVLSIYASTLVRADWWTHSFGMGGLFGDTVLSMLLTLVPLGAGVAVKIWSLLSGAVVVVLGLFVLGFTWAEVKRGMRLGLIGVILLYAAMRRALGMGAEVSMRAAGAARDRAASRAEKSRVNRAEPTLLDEDDDDLETARPGLLGRLRLRTPEPLPEPELVEPDLSELPEDVEAPDEARIRARINDAIRARVRSPQLTAAAPAPKADGRIEPTLTGATMARLAGPQPLVARTAPATPEVIEDDDAVALFEEHHEPEEQAPTAAPVQRAKVQHPARKPAAVSTRAKAEAQPQLQFDEGNGDDYETPPLSLLASPGTVERHVLSDEALEENARMLETVLDDYGVKGDIVSVRPGPVVTMYELEPAPGLKASRVIGLSDDIARSMSALSARVSTVPGRSVIGIELPNEKREMVVLREMLSHRDFGDGTQALPLALGKDIGGDPVIANLAKMPHLLIAGTTGSGKSVAINTMILSLLYKLSPEECRLIMIDPKMLELSVYDGIPHLLSPVVTDPKKAVVALKWTVGEMEERYRKMSKMGVRNIDGYNARVKDALAKGETFSRTVQTGFDEETGDPVFETEELTPERMPYIVVIVDEMADLMMVAGKEIEACIQRLAQMARASGIHIIMATQRPSVDVITGTIKANFPTRISFSVTSKVDSRTILGEQGAEQLLGMGDMLYMAGGAKITRVHGPFVSDEEVEEIVSYLKQYGPPDYKSGVVDGPEDEKASDIDAVLGLGGNTNGEDALYDQAVQIVAKDRKCSTSYIQRKLAIGYNKAARLVEQMEDEGVVSSANHVGKREVLVPEVA